MRCGTRAFVAGLLALGAVPLLSRQLPPARVLEVLVPSEDVVVATVGSAAVPSLADLGRCLSHVEATAQEPCSYVAGKFREKDLVLLAEAHWLEAHTDFVVRCIEPVVAAGVRDFAFEFSNVQCQASLDAFLAKPEPDLDLLYGALVEEYDLFGWPYAGYVKVFLKLHEAQRRLRGRGDALAAHLVDAPLRVPEARDGWFRDRHMARVVGGLLRQGRKVLFSCGATHGTTNLRGKRGRYPTAGGLLFEEFGTRVFAVKLHHLAQDAGTGRFTPFAGGLFDDVLVRHGAPAGFDLVGSPFADLRANAVPDTLLSSSDDGCRLTDAWQGWVFPAATSERRFCGLEEAMFERRFVHRKLERDGFLLGLGAWLLFSPEQLAGACLLYRLRGLGLEPYGF